jgi:hypothetical protein
VSGWAQTTCKDEGFNLGYVYILLVFISMKEAHAKTHMHVYEYIKICLGPGDSKWQESRVSRKRCRLLLVALCCACWLLSAVAWLLARRAISKHRTQQRSSSYTA